MPSLQKKANKEQFGVIWNSALPWSTRLKGKLWFHLRCVWLGLMVLTVLCVAIQILGVIRQSRSPMVLKQTASENILSMKFTIEFKETHTTPQRAPKQGHSDHKSPVRYFQQWNTESTASVPGQSLQRAERPGELWERGMSTWAPGSPGQEPQREKAQPAYNPQATTPPGRWHKAGMVTQLLAGGAEPLSLQARNTAVEARSVPGLDRQRGLSAAEVGISTGLGKTVGQRPWDKSPALVGPNADPWISRGANPMQVVSESTVPKSVSFLRGQGVTPLPSTLPFRAMPLTPAREVTCEPKTHIFFLKTHKTASSTILNILYRYGDQRNLTFALPVGRYSQLFYPNHFTADFVEGFRTKAVKHYDIMCNHMRFMTYEVKKIMPADTFYFSILRNPVSMMESIFTYYKGIPAFLKTKTLDEFMDNPSKLFNVSLLNNHYAQNLLSFDFGFVNSYVARDKERHARTSIVLIEKYFDLVLISEYFDESMILLKNALCWTLDDVVAFRLNSRSDKTRRELSVGTMEKIKAWNWLDWKMYLHFNATFWRKVDVTVGRDEMRREVAKLRQRRELLMKTCLMEGGAVDPSQVKDRSLKPFQYGAAVIQGYNLNPRLVGRLKKKCQDLITPELQYTSALYDKQFPELAAKIRLSATKKQTAPQQVSNSSMRLRAEAQRRSIPRGPRHQGPSVRPEVFPKGPTMNSLQNMP